MNVRSLSPFLFWNVTAAAAQKALGMVKESFAGPPEVIKGVVEWDHQHGKAAPAPPPKKAAVAVASVAMGDSDYKEKMAAIYAAKTKPPWIKEPNAEKYSIEAVQARVNAQAPSRAPAGCETHIYDPTLRRDKHHLVEFKAKLQEQHVEELARVRRLADNRLEELRGRGLATGVAVVAIALGSWVWLN